VEKANKLADNLVESLKKIYTIDSSLDARVRAQQKAFEILCGLEVRGYDMSEPLGKILDVMIYYDKS